MTFMTRWLLVVIILGFTSVVHWTLRHHVEAARPPVVMALQQPLSELPRQLDDWSGRDGPMVDEMRYADECLNRRYSQAGRRQSLTAWFIYSRDGSDRLHHPEICMAVSGIPENPQARSTVALTGPGAPAQEYSLGQGADSVLVFYWHYTLWPPADKSVTAVQQLYQRLHHRPASLTLQVFAPCQSVEDAVAARGLVKRLDLEIQSYVGPDAIRGNRRLPIGNANEI